MALNLIFAVSCSQQGAKTGKEEPTQAAAPSELRLPDIPSILTEPSARAAYLLAHYWDSLDFADTRQSLDTAFMEQNFANFLSLFPHAEAPVHAAAMEALVERAGADADASAFVMEIAEKYLADPNSPMRSDALYAAYARAALAGSRLPDIELERTRWLLEGAEKNLPGTKAPDFAFTLADGNRSTLNAAAGLRPYTLLYFYDPDCENCQAATAAIANSPQIAEQTANGTLTVLAIYPDGTDRDLWQTKARQLPPSWTIGMNDGSIEERDLYRLTALPSLYLLQGRTIALKDADLRQVLGLLQN